MSERNVRARFSGTLQDAQDVRARHDGELKSAQSIYVRDNGELVQVWPRPSAIPDSVVENFEAADADPPGVYESGQTIEDYYSGETGFFSRTTSNAIEGNNSLQFDGSSGTNGAIWSHDGLNRYPQKGDTFSAYLRDPDVSDNLIPAFMFGVPESVDSVSGFSGYGVYHHPSDNGFGTYRVDDNSYNNLVTGSVSMSLGSIYEYEVEWHDGSGSEADNTIVTTVYEVDQSSLNRQSQLASINATDSNYATATGVGWHRRASTGDIGTMGDGYRITGSVQ